MTAQASIPLKWYVPFANGDAGRVELPVTTADPTRASQTLGFPPLTMQPPESGGVPPQGEDFNGGMNQVARIAWWVLNGGGWPYDATFATNSNINGYPNGAKLQSADFRGDWISVADNNQNNPDTNGTSWVPGFQYGSTAVTGLTGGTVTLTPAQAAKGSITLAGTLTSASTIIMPTWTKNWDITNNTTGAFVVIVKTLAGSGVTIPQNGAPTRVSGDGTNITAIAANLGQIKSIKSQTFIASGTYTPSAGMAYCIVDNIGGGGGGGGAVGAGTGSAAGGGGGSGAYCRSIFTAATIGASQTVTIGIAGVGGTAGATGNTGGTTTFGALMTSVGGTGGTGAANNTAIGSLNAGGAGGTTVSGNIANVQGQRGGVGIGFASVSSKSGYGGSTLYGAGGGETFLNTGNGGAGSGSGGAGGSATTVSVAGGSGSAGVVIITEFCTQ